MKNLKIKILTLVFAALAVEEEAHSQQPQAAEGSAQHSQPVGAGLGQNGGTACGQNGRGDSVYCAVTLAMT